MRFTLVTLACLIATGCSGSGAASGPVIATTEEAPLTFLGLNLGAEFDLPECSRYSAHGDYKVPSLQAVTPCFTKPIAELIAVDGAPVLAQPDEPLSIVILFASAQVPAGISTMAPAKLQARRLVELRAPLVADSNLSDLSRIRGLLADKYGSPSEVSPEGDPIWTSATSVMTSYAPQSGAPGGVLAVSRRYAEWLAQRRPSSASF